MANILQLIMTPSGKCFIAQIIPNLILRLAYFALMMLPMLTVMPGAYANATVKATLPVNSARQTMMNNIGMIAAGNAALVNAHEEPSGLLDFQGTYAFPERVVILGGLDNLQRRNISSDFGKRNTLGGSQYHEGIDITVPSGSPILAAGFGKVIYAGFSRGYGNLVVIDHGDGITTRYAHAQQIYVQLGQRVSAAQIIAAVGSTGNARTAHLHFELRQYQQPLDPAVLLGLNDDAQRRIYPAMNLAKTKPIRKTPRQFSNKGAPNKTSSVLYSHDLKTSTDGGLKRRITPKPMYLSKNASEARQDSVNSR